MGRKAMIALAAVVVPRSRRHHRPPMRHKALIAFVSVLMLGAFWAWPAFHEPPDHSCTSDDEGSWSYKVTSRTWDCGELGWHIGRYGFSGI